ncbi:MAG: protein phosphatase 2C domain-containing protein, partial [Ignavibacteriaceae bacterium]|nr:protein phosphatase 2C domain-containing protein [Ignavibacteriaceae bacterium]
MKLTYRQFNHIGLRRLNNEDAAGIVEIDRGLLSIVCDGLGGSQAGEIASKTVVESIIEYFSSENDTHDYIEKIRSAVTYANKSVFDRALNNSLLSGMATTAEVLFLKDYTAYWAHVGDSRI